MRPYAWINGEQREYIAWDVDFDWTKNGRLRFLDAVIACHCRVTDSMFLGRGVPQGRIYLPESRATVLAKVFIPEGYESEFDELAKPYERRKPPVISVMRGVDD